MASVMSETKNSSKQITRASAAKRLAMMVSGFFSPPRVFISSCTRLHEAVEVSAGLFLERQRLEEGVDQVSLAATHATPRSTGL